MCVCRGQLCVCGCKGQFYVCESVVCVDVGGNCV